jgi:hypothetical protein
MHKWTDDRWSGVLLITSAILGVFVMAHHPTARSVLSAGNPEAAARLNRLLHGVALAAMPLQFLGLLGLSRRLGESLCTRAALVTQAFGLVAGMGAAVASGFVATQVLLETIQAGPSAPSSPLLGYTGMWNQGFAAVYVIATAISIMLWSVALLRGNQLSKACGWLGVLVGSAVLVWRIVGGHHLGVHHFGFIVLGEGVWLVWVGLGLMGERRSVAP